MYACLDILRQRITRVCACNWSENTKKMAEKIVFLKQSFVLNYKILFSVDFSRKQNDQFRNKIMPFLTKY